MNFREVDRKLCLIRDSRLAQVLDPEQKTQADAVLFCGYIDHTRGLTYQVLGLVCCKGNDYALVSDAQVAGLKVRADAVDEERVRPIENKALEELLRDRIDKLSVYYANKDVVAIRAMEEIDPFRHPQYPDDMCAIFLMPVHRLEQMWVRAEMAARTGDGTLLIGGILLNEPDNVPDLHMGAVVTLTVIETKCGRPCVGVPGMVVNYRRVKCGAGLQIILFCNKSIID